ncbi:DnaJ-domain-containing protein [Russula earlei]|uniref:DnaJ-domain-containing protein n=1 Tax=Russula earlei TaxID=71964 RepID=A0ACC0UIY3_9AGAM|nr:DnaJ-domain-containing protein [Russula earlei]
MPSSTAKAMFSLIGWSYIPDFITGTLLRWAGPYLRTPVTPLHYRLTFAFVVLSYLVYNFLEASLSTPRNFYELLDISPASDGVKIKTAFRAFARRYHPDRVGPEGSDLFVAVREGYEALMEPNKRWAYDRFGAEILSCKECVTQREFLARGLIQSLGFHIVSGLALLFFSAIGRSSSVAFWRYTLFFGHFASELSLLFSPSPSSPEYQGYSILSLFFPTRLAFQHIRLLHQLFMFFSIAVSRVAPVLFPDAEGEASSLFLAQRAAATLEKASNVDRELQNMIDMQMLSVKPLGSKRTDDPDEHTLELLTREMEHLVIENRLTAIPAVSDLGRARSNVLKRVKAQLQDRPHLRKRTLSQSQRSIVPGQLPSPISPLLKRFGGSAGVEVIDVDALPDEKSQPKQRRMAMIELETLRSEAGPTFATCLRARSKSC